MPSLNERSLINFGDGGFAIVLPKAWIRYHKLRAGDRLTVITNGEVRIIPKTKVTTKKTWTFRVIKEQYVPLEYWIIDEEKIKAAIKDGVRYIPGIEVFQEEESSN